MLLLVTAFALLFTSATGQELLDELLTFAETVPRNFIKLEVLDDLVEESKGNGKISVLNNYNDGKNYRLPNNTIPLHYDIVLRTNIHRPEFEFFGDVKIRIQAIETTNNITLHYRGQNIVAVDLSNADGELIERPSWRLQEDVDFLIIEPAAQLIKGKIYQVRISYNGILRDDNRGFYRSSYVDDRGRTHWLASTQFESTNARHAFPW